MGFIELIDMNGDRVLFNMSKVKFIEDLGTSCSLDLGEGSSKMVKNTFNDILEMLV